MKASERRAASGATRCGGLMSACGRPKDKPFVICAGFHRPHMPWIAPKKYFDLYKDAEIELPPIPDGVARVILKEDRGSGVSKDAALWNEGVTDAEARELVKGYLASVSYSDAQVGRVLAELEKSGQADNTIVILWGDHGYHLTEHGLWRKNTIYHVANRIPLLPAHRRRNDRRGGRGEKPRRPAHPLRVGLLALRRGRVRFHRRQLRPPQAADALHHRDARHPARPQRRVAARGPRQESARREISAHPRRRESRELRRRPARPGLAPRRRSNG
jgi:hypothetical protein